MKHSLALVLLAASTAAFAQIGDLGNTQGKIGSVKVSPSPAKAGQPVTVTIEADGGTLVNCGMLVSYDDGSSDNVKISNGNQKMPLTLTHTYAKAGIYSIKAEGRKVTTHLACPGTATAKLTVEAAPVAAPVAAAAPSCPEGYKMKGKPGKAGDFTCNAGKGAKAPEKAGECATGLEYFTTKTTLGCRKAKAKK